MERLHIAQPAFTQSSQQLESELGSLFHHESLHLRLTEAAGSLPLLGVRGKQSTKHNVTRPFPRAKFSGLQTIDAKDRSQDRQVSSRLITSDRLHSPPESKSSLDRGLASTGGA
jgi:hypothetical protein